MWDIATMKRRASYEDPGAAESSSGGGAAAIDRVRRNLQALGCAHLRARMQGEHVVIDRDQPSRGRSSVARLTAMGRDGFGVAFRTANGGWEPMLLVDTLEVVVAGISAAFGPPCDELAVAS
jgi:hypothetical protein